MSLNCFIVVRKHLVARIQCINIGGCRHYARWTHRRPVMVVEESISKGEKEKWKLAVEREITDNSVNKTFSFVTDNSSALGSHGESISKTLLKDNFFSEDSNTERLSIPNSNVRVEDKISNSEQNNVKSNPKLNEHNPMESEERNVGRTLSKRALEKRKVFSEKELNQAIKLRLSADKHGVPLFTNLGTNDTVLSRYIVNVKCKKKRQQVKFTLLEGMRLIRDAVDAGAKLEALFFSRISDLKELNLPAKGVNIYKLSYKKLCLWSDVKTPQGLLAILKIPDISKKRASTLPLTVICDNIRDPGNMGTILRTCAGVGCSNVILTKGCVDLWEPKVLRAGAGAHFRVPVIQAESWSEIEEQIDLNSLNCIAQSNVLNHLTSGGYGKIDSSNCSASEVFDIKKNLCSERLLQVPTVPYYSVDYTSAPSVVLFLGGETEGTSSEVYEFVSKTSGVCVNIPMSNNVESLNSGIALGVVAFEIKKQYLVKGVTSDPGEEPVNSSKYQATVSNI